MDQMAVAFERAGFPAGILAFASACHDLARLALNQQPNPDRAAHAWLGMASGRNFRDGPLRAFLEVVARGQQQASSAAEAGQGRADTHHAGAPSAAETSSDAAAGHAARDAHPAPAPAASETEPAGEAGLLAADTHAAAAPSPVRSEHSSDQRQTSGGGAGQGSRDTQPTSAPPLPETGHGGGGQITGDTHSQSAPAPVYKEPTRVEIKAMIEQRRNTARVMSGVYLTDRKGDKHPMDEIYVSSLGRRLEVKGKQVAEDGIEYNTLYLVKAACEKPAFVPRDAKVGDILEAHEIRHMQEMARAFARSPMVRIPQSLRHFTDAA